MPVMANEPIILNVYDMVSKDADPALAEKILVLLCLRPYLRRMGMSARTVCSTKLNPEKPRFSILFVVFRGSN